MLGSKGKVEMSVVELVEDDTIVLWGKDEKPFFDVEKTLLKCYNGNIHLKLIQAYLVIRSGAFFWSSEKRLLWFPFISNYHSEFFETFIQSPDKQHIPLDNGSASFFHLLENTSILSQISLCSIKPHVYVGGQLSIYQSYDIQLIWDKGSMEVNTSTLVNLDMLNLIYSSTLGATSADTMLIVGDFCLEPSKIYNISFSFRNALYIQTSQTSSWIFIDNLNNDMLQVLYFKVPPILQSKFCQFDFYHFSSKLIYLVPITVFCVFGLYRYRCT